MDGPILRTSCPHVVRAVFSRQSVQSGLCTVSMYPSSFRPISARRSGQAHTDCTRLHPPTSLLSTHAALYLQNPFSHHRLCALSDSAPGRLSCGILGLWAHTPAVGVAATGPPRTRAKTPRPRIDPELNTEAINHGIAFRDKRFMLVRAVVCECKRCLAAGGYDAGPRGGCSRVPRVPFQSAGI